MVEYSKNEKLREVRNTLNLTLGDVHSLTGIAHDRISEIEDGGDNPTTSELLLISLAYELPDRLIAKLLSQEHL